MKIGHIKKVLETVDSTNELAKRWAKEGAEEGSVVIALEQTKGRGRSGKTWQSPNGEGLWMSIVLRPKLSPTYIPQLTLIAGQAVCEALRSITNSEVQIKWPNDIILNNKKIGGILCEMQCRAESVNYAIIGIGINVGMTHFPDTLPHASSFFIENNTNYNHEYIIESICQLFELYYNSFQKIKNISFIKEKYVDNCITLNKKVKIINNEKTYEAYVEDISDEGVLIVRNEVGELIEVFAGDVSVRGLYGYV
ncbi:MAG: biotin--[acetyl-CoA-carboxylase] ligase [Cellulosilyticaceae bacterium]